VAIPRRIPVRFDDVFPHGAFVLGVEPANDYDKVKAGAADPQERDKDTGERVWAVKVLDADPQARSAELKVKITAPVHPVPPDAVAGTPFRPVEFTGLTVTPWVDVSRNKPRVGFALRASGMQPVTTGAASAAGRRAGTGAAA
jgi:hypothetical protein